MSTSSGFTCSAALGYQPCVARSPRPAVGRPPDGRDRPKLPRLCDSVFDANSGLVRPLPADRNAKPPSGGGGFAISWGKAPSRLLKASFGLLRAWPMFHMGTIAFAHTAFGRGFGRSIRPVYQLLGSASAASGEQQSSWRLHLRLSSFTTSSYQSGNANQVPNKLDPSPCSR